MTVKELIAVLQQHDPNAVVVSVGVDSLLPYGFWENEVQVIRWEDINDLRNAAPGTWAGDIPEGIPIVAVFGGIQSTY